MDFLLTYADNYAIGKNEEFLSLEIKGKIYFIFI